MPDVLKQLGIDKKHGEGWFFPDTYSFTKGRVDVAILKKAHQKMQTTLDEEWQQKQAGLPLKDAYQALILASIIEKTGISDERGQIAGVFTRRLQKQMLLQTDPTVIYGMGDKFKGDIRKKDLRNRYDFTTLMTCDGLPPTPIAMPGREAIHAALHPVVGKSLYFVAKGGGAAFVFRQFGAAY